MILPDVRDGARDAVLAALGEELGAETPGLDQLAESLVAIAIEYGCSIDSELLFWIHFRSPEKEWSAREFRRWAESLQSLKRELEQRAGAAGNDAQLCHQCFAHVAQRTHEARGWWCPYCGLVSDL